MTTYGSVAAIALCAVFTTVAAVMSYIQAGRQAVAAADLGALSAAYIHLSGTVSSARTANAAEGACAIAQTVVESNKAHMQQCVLDGDRVNIAVSVPIGMKIMHNVGAQRYASATAGPAESTEPVELAELAEAAAPAESLSSER